MRSFFSLRETPGLKKKPTTSELLDWLKLLLNEDVSPETLREREAKKLIPPLHGALLKNEQDVHLFEKLAFLSRRESWAPQRINLTVESRRAQDLEKARSKSRIGRCRPVHSRRSRSACEGSAVTTNVTVTTA